jgi:non-specific serine/threonine protein kinase
MHDAEGSEQRFLLLHVMREYALEQLEASGEADALGRAHLAYCETLVEESYHGVMRGVVEPRWVRQLEREHDNLRAALRWSLIRGEVERGLRLAIGASVLWEYAGYFSEGQRWLDDLLASHVGAEFSDDPIVRAQAIRRSGLLAEFRHDVESAMARAKEALSLARRTGDLDLIATTLTSHAMIVVIEQGDEQDLLAQCQRDLEEAVALARQVRSARLGWHVQVLGSARLAQGDAEQALILFQEALELSRQVGDSETIANALFNVGAAYCLLSDPDRARPALIEALYAHRAQGYLMGISWTLLGLVLVNALDGQGERAARLFGAQEALLASLGGGQPTLFLQVAAQLMSPAREALGEERWAAAYAAGQALSLEQAIAEALQGAGEPQ